MDTLNTIQNAETKIQAGTDLYRYKYNLDEVDIIVKEAQRQKEIDTLKNIILYISKKSL